jgi:predicted small lipoprotein YifL
MFEGAMKKMMFAVVLTASLTACGQTGPLYMPDQGGEVVTRPAGQAQPQSPETAPTPATQTPADTTTKPNDEKKNQPPR